MNILSFDIGIKNLAFCEILAGRIERWEILPLADSSKITINDLIGSMIRKMTEVFTEDILQSYDFVLIENQPCMKAPTMKSLQIAVMTFCMMKGCKEIRLINASNKLKVSFNEAKGEKLTYSQKKKKSVELALMYITRKENDQILNKFKSNKKKDDLADSLLQAIYFIECVPNYLKVVSN